VTVCVYGLTTAAAGRIAQRGMTGETLGVVTVDGIRAIIGAVRGVPKPSADVLQRYDRVIRSLWTRTPALLPARYGTRFDSVDDLRLVLSARRRTLAADLKRVRGRTQMTVRVLSDSGPVVPPPSRAATGTAYLRDRAARARIDGVDPILAAVRRFVREEKVEKGTRVATLYHLVPRGSAEQYRHAIEKAAANASIRLVVTGPHPPYAFA
jgi:hypothetical protein